MISSFLGDLTTKSGLLKKQILGFCVTEGSFCIPDISRVLNASIPTVSKLVVELIGAGCLEDLGKQGTSGGRKPSSYGLCAAAGYIVGVDVTRHHLNIAICNFKGETVVYLEGIPFQLESTEASFRQMCGILTGQVGNAGIPKEKILAYGINLTGRVNRESGYSYSYFLGEERPLSPTLESILDCPVFVENDTRAMTYGEYICGVGDNERNMLFINVSWGLGMGMILDGKLFYGKSGFSGEIGHFPFQDNEILCRCGKKGCLETVASGSAIHRIFMENLREGKASTLRPKFEAGEEITLEDIIEAEEEEDVLAIETIESIGAALGRAIAGLINIFNPELVVIGGRLAVAREYLMLPVLSAIKKSSLTLVNKDTNIKFSKLGMRAGALGACVLTRSKLLGIV